MMRKRRHINSPSPWWWQHHFAKIKAGDDYADDQDVKYGIVIKY